MWFVKSKRAQTSDDDETWIAGGVAPTLNAFDMGDTRATVIILDGTRVGDVRVYEDSIMQTVIQRWGTGGGNVPAIGFYESGPGYILEIEKTGVIRSEGENRPSRPTHTILENQMTVRRLTPTECERLQGFPDGWTDGQADSHRYKQMGNAVAVPVVEWIINRIIK
jgi:site-specific DNA-cytosine methylase